MSPERHRGTGSAPLAMSLLGVVAGALLLFTSVQDGLASTPSPSATATPAGSAEPSGSPLPIEHSTRSSDVLLDLLQAPSGCRARTAAA